MSSYIKPDVNAYRFPSYVWHIVLSYPLVYTSESNFPFSVTFIEAGVLLMNHLPKFHPLFSDITSRVLFTFVIYQTRFPSSNPNSIILIMTGIPISSSLFLIYNISHPEYFTLGPGEVRQIFSRSLCLDHVSVTIPITHSHFRS